MGIRTSGRRADLRPGCRAGIAGVAPLPDRQRLPEPRPEATSSTASLVGLRGVGTLGHACRRSDARCRQQFLSPSPAPLGKILVLALIILLHSEASAGSSPQGPVGGSMITHTSSLKGPRSPRLALALLLIPPSRCSCRCSIWWCRRARPSICRPPRDALRQIRDLCRACPRARSGVGYCGILSLATCAFLRARRLRHGMYLMRQIGTRGVYGDPILPDFSGVLNWKELPWYWWG